MNIISHEMGRILVLFPVEEIRPSFGLYIPHFVNLVKTKYGFVRFPDLSIPLDEFYKNGYVFTHGTVNVDGVNIVVEEMGIFNDGVTVTCRTTDDAGRAWAEIMNWATQEFKLGEMISAPVHLYRSQIVVEFDKHIAASFEGIAKISRTIGDSIRSNITNSNDPEFLGIRFGFDKQTQSGISVANFIIERRAGVPFASNRFFCEAPLPTPEHLNVLQNIEANFLAT